MSLRIGHVAYATLQGLGVMARSFYDAGVVTEPIIYRHSRHNHVEWYPPDTPQIAVRNFFGTSLDEVLRRVDVMLFYETPFDWSFLPHCKAMGVKTVLIPMYEWTPKTPPYWFDKVIAPSKLDRDYFPGSVYLPIPVDPRYWKPRTHARTFLHNCGHLGHREHKGTRELLEAVKYVRSSEFRLTVRGQGDSGLQKLAQRVFPRAVDPRLAIEIVDIPHDRLWAEDTHDVYVAPEKFNGLSLPLQEARAAGMLVMASDRYPHNDWLPREPLVPVASYSRASISSSYLEFDEARIEPKAIAAKIDEWVGCDIIDYSLSGREWAEANSWTALKPKWLEELNRW